MNTTASLPNLPILFFVLFLSVLSALCYALTALSTCLPNVFLTHSKCVFRENVRFIAIDVLAFYKRKQVFMFWSWKGGKWSRHGLNNTSKGHAARKFHYQLYSGSILQTETVIYIWNLLNHLCSLLWGLEVPKEELTWWKLKCYCK